LPAAAAVAATAAVSARNSTTRSHSSHAQWVLPTRVFQGVTGCISSRECQFAATMPGS
jgi:hypothetical protein